MSSLAEGEGSGSLYHGYGDQNRLFPDNGQISDDNDNSRNKQLLLLTRNRTINLAGGTLLGLALISESVLVSTSFFPSQIKWALGTLAVPIDVIFGAIAARNVFHGLTGK